MERELLVPFCEYRGFQIFHSWFWGVIEFPDWDEMFDYLDDLKDYIDYCLDFEEEYL